MVCLECTAVVVYMQGRGFNSFTSNMILSLNETERSSLLARTRALILYISIWKFDFGPETLPGLSRNASLNRWFYTCSLRRNRFFQKKAARETNSFKITTYSLQTPTSSFCFVLYPYWSKEKQRQVKQIKLVVKDEHYQHISPPKDRQKCLWHCSNRFCDVTAPSQLSCPSLLRLDVFTKRWGRLYRGIKQAVFAFLRLAFFNRS